MPTTLVRFAGCNTVHRHTGVVNCSRVLAKILANVIAAVTSELWLLLHHVRRCETADMTLLMCRYPEPATSVHRDVCQRECQPSCPSAAYVPLYLGF